MAITRKLDRMKVGERGKEDEIILTCTSVFGTSVILTKRTFEHIKNRHPEVLRLLDLFEKIKATIETPDFIAKGRTNEYISLRQIPDTHRFLAIFYVEESRIKTPFITSKIESFKRRGVIWPK